MEAVAVMRLLVLCGPSQVAMKSTQPLGESGGGLKLGPNPVLRRHAVTKVTLVLGLIGAPWNLVAQLRTGPSATVSNAHVPMEQVASCAHTASKTLLVGKEAIAPGR